MKTYEILLLIITLFLGISFGLVISAHFQTIPTLPIASVYIPCGNTLHGASFYNVEIHIVGTCTTESVLGNYDSK